MNKYQRLIITVAIIDLIVILLFPPFVERTLARNAFPSFDSFYFLFGDRSARPLFLPLLQLEIFFVLINALALFLLFNAVQRQAELMVTLGRKAERRHHD